MIGVALLVVYVMGIAGILTTWPHGRDWGYHPSGGFGVLLAVFLVLAMLGPIALWS